MPKLPEGGLPQYFRPVLLSFVEVATSFCTCLNVYDITNVPWFSADTTTAKCIEVLRYKEIDVQVFLLFTDSQFICSVSLFKHKDFFFTHDFCNVAKKMNLAYLSCLFNR